MARQHSSGDLLADRRYAYAEACLAEGDAQGAAEMAEQALELAPRYAPAWALLGRAREALHAAGRPEALAGALHAYATALDLDPDDAFGTRLHLARLGAADGAPAISPAYVRALFDGYSSRFERHLVEGLGYCGPALLTEAIGRIAGPQARFERALDLGCGTGLMGAALAGRLSQLAGVDLSPGMLARAAAKTSEGRPLYDRLVQADLLPFLADEPAGGADLVTAADVFIYLGDLAPVLAAIARVLAPGGLAAFTIQSPDGEGAGVGLGEDARFAHSDAHLREAARAAGLDIVLMEPAAIRRERGCGVPGRIAVLRRP